MITTTAAAKSPVERCRAYVRQMPEAVQGQGGDQATLAAAMVCHDFGLSEEDAMSVMSEFNARCSPPWQPGQLLAKIRSAARSAKRPAGWKMEGKQPGQAKGMAAAKPVEKLPAPRKEPEPMPAMWMPTIGELEAIARLRCLPFASVWNAAKRYGFLKCCRYQGHECFAILAGESAQMRRMDGGLLKVGFEQKKTRNLEGRSMGWNLLPGRENTVFLLEGVISLLEGLALLQMGGMMAHGEPRWGILAAMQAEGTIPDAILERLAGHNVRIIPDNDYAGTRSVRKWWGRLKPVAAAVDVMPVAAQHKDPGDFLKTQPSRDELALYFQPFANSNQPRP